MMDQHELNQAVDKIVLAVTDAETETDFRDHAIMFSTWTCRLAGQEFSAELSQPDMREMLSTAIMTIGDDKERLEQFRQGLLAVYTALLEGTTESEYAN